MQHAVICIYLYARGEYFREPLFESDPSYTSSSGGGMGYAPPSDAPEPPAAAASSRLARAARAAAAPALADHDDDGADNSALFGGSRWRYRKAGVAGSGQGARLDGAARAPPQPVRGLRTGGAANGAASDDEEANDGLEL